MKNLLTILMICLYLLGNTGVVLSKHFCGSRIAHISLFGKKKTCACGKVKMPKSCCKDTSVKLSTDDNQKLSDFDFTAHNDFNIIGKLPQSYTFPLAIAKWSQQKATKLFVLKTAPPKIPIYLQLHAFLI